MTRNPVFFIINGDLSNNISIYESLKKIHKEETNSELRLVSLDTHRDIEFDFERDTVFIFDKIKDKTKEHLKKLSDIKYRSVKFALNRSSIKASLYDESLTLEVPCEVFNSKTSYQVNIERDGILKTCDVSYLYEFKTFEPKLGSDIDNFYMLCTAFVSTKLSKIKRDKLLRQLYRKLT